MLWLVQIPETFNLQLIIFVFWVTDAFFFMSYKTIYIHIVLNSDSRHWLTEHITSHDPCCVCSDSWVATMCVRSKYYAIVLLDDSVYIDDMCEQIWWSKHFTAQHNWEKCADSFSAIISIITCIYHMYVLSNGMQILFSVDGMVSTYWEVCPPTTPRMWPQSHNVFLNCMFSGISDMWYVLKSLCAFPPHVHFSLGSSWCTCNATSLSLQRCQRCFAKGRM